MTREQFERELGFHAADALAKRLLTLGVIGEADYTKIREHFVQKYCPLIAGL